MQAVATWLVARPLNAVLALAATISLLWFSFLSGVVLILLMLQKGPRTAAVYAAFAVVLTLVFGQVAGVPAKLLIQQMLSIWLPAMLLGTILIATRSLTLTLQVAFIIAVAMLLVFFLVAGDVSAFWRSLLLDVGNVWREIGRHKEADMLAADIDTIARQMTMLVATVIFSLQAVSCVLGYKLYRALPGKSDAFGRFRDLDFGRVLALVMALTSAAALATGALWLQSTAFVMFAMFWLQGLAIVHWSHSQGYLPTFGMVAVYILMPFLNVILLMGLAVTGYIDAWFRFRRLKTA